MEVEVECYAGFKADERPLRFRMGEHRYQVITVLDRWYGPSEQFFKVQADDGNQYILLHSWASGDNWTLKAFRTTAPGEPDWKA